MTTEQLRNSILQEAISGRLVPQDPNDEPMVILSSVPEDDIPFEIPSSWRWVFLKDCAAIIGGYAFPSASIKGEKGVRVIRISDISEKGFVNKSVVRYNGHENLDKFKIIPQDILIAMTGGTVGKSLFVQQMGEDMLLNQRVAIIRNNGQFAPYIDIVVKSPHIKSFINDKKNSTNDNISMGDINSFLVPLPPLAEQKRIVAKLEELLPIVEQYGKAQKELDELNAALPARLRQSILQEAISGRLVPQNPNDEPTAALLQRIREEKARLVKEGKLKKKDLVETPITDEEKPFEIPETWNWCRLGELAFERMGKTPPRGESEYWLNAKYPWVSISDMKDYGHVKMTKERVSEYAAKKAFRQISPIGSLLMSFKLTVGRTSILDIAAYHNEAIITIQPYIDQEFAFRNYLFYVLPLIANLGDSKDAIKGKTLNSTSLYNLYIPLPPLAEQQRIVAKIEELFEQIDKISK